jgi:hypothetical protein
MRIVVMENSVAQKSANVFRRGVPCTVAAADDEESNGASAASTAAPACAMGPGFSDEHRAAAHC